LNPLNLLNPLNPVNPLNPLNPFNLFREHGDEQYRGDRAGRYGYGNYDYDKRYQDTDEPFESPSLLELHLIRLET
jgi:hypothetical protein